MKAEKKLVQQRLSVLQLAEALRNVSLACRQRGVSRSQFYEYKRRFQTHGLEGLKDLPPIAKSHPMTTPPETVKKIKALALKHPAWGCQRLEALLKAEGISVSYVTVQKILDRNNLGSRYQRWLALEEKAANKATQLSAEQVAFIEKQNPCFKERHIHSEKPGQLLNQDTFYVGYLKGVGKVYLHAVVDTYSSYAFAFLHTSKQPEAAVAVLHNDVLPFYRKIKLSIQTILTDNGREFCGKESHPYQLFLALNDIEHRTTRVRSPRTNGFVERFNRTILDEFFRVKFRQKLYNSVQQLQKEMDRWLLHYNKERPHLGYRNMGRKPFETIKLFLNNSVAKGA
jgi:transposase InsO family protein